MPPQVEWQMWRQLRGAFRIKRLVLVPRVPEFDNYSFDQYDTMEEALASCEGERVFLEPNGAKTLSELPQGDIVLVCGNTAMNNMVHAEPNETYTIKSPQRTHLYGTNAAAIALAIRYGQ